MTLRISEADLVRDVRSVLDKVQQGSEVIIEREDHRPVVMKQLHASGRKLSDCIALAKAYEAKLGYAPVPDADFAKDIEEGIESRRGAIRNVWSE